MSGLPTVRDVLTADPTAVVCLFRDPDDGQWVAHLEGAGDPDNLTIRVADSPVNALLCLLCADVPAVHEAAS
ncbi:hypothetical protein EHF33_20510 (plasmid) [Deinococcus psychrotolerans]|uniref:Uncharacterized protein n=1 Tax=Deinococcus psychrotolerans TaxID=2489213 RepID=A0A3G8YRY1_9DEIO|nr:hypothetical protein [Deinococcus psychrotolerans]AZI45294.1 hypothetical protein EHF33_20510 [Deinococcus psychrotolerans]